MNLTDFIDQLQVSLEDLSYSKDNGFVKGVTNIFAKQLQDLNLPNAQYIVVIKNVYNFT